MVGNGGNCCASAAGFGFVGCPFFVVFFSRAFFFVYSNEHAFLTCVDPKATKATCHFLSVYCTNRLNEARGWVRVQPFRLGS